MMLSPAALTRVPAAPAVGTDVRGWAGSRIPKSSWVRVPGKPAAFDCGLLSTNNGLLCFSVVRYQVITSSQGLMAQSVVLGFR